MVVAAAALGLAAVLSVVAIRRTATPTPPAIVLADVPPSAEGGGSTPFHVVEGRALTTLGGAAPGQGARPASAAATPGAASGAPATGASATGASATGASGTGSTVSAPPGGVVLTVPGGSAVSPPSITLPAGATGGATVPTAPGVSVPPILPTVPTLPGLPGLPGVSVPSLPGVTPSTVALPPLNLRAEPPGLQAPGGP